MRPRVRIGRFLIRFGRFIQSMALPVMKPNDLVEFSQQTYKKPKNVAYYCQDSIVDSGLTADELFMLEKLPRQKGRLLVLGMGGGREAFFFARKGYEVTGVDFIGEMVKKAVENAKQQGLKITGLVQEITTLDLQADNYDVVWLSPAIYSYIPTRKKRIETMKKMAEILKQDGYILCQFHWNEKISKQGVKKIIMKAGAIFSGNFRYETGDTLWRNSEFVHEFFCEHLLRTEFEEGGFEEVCLKIPEGKYIGEALLRKE